MLELLFVHYLALYRVSIYYLLSLYVLLIFMLWKSCRNKLNWIELNWISLWRKIFDTECLLLTSIWCQRCRGLRHGAGAGVSETFRADYAAHWREIRETNGLRLSVSLVVHNHWFYTPSVNWDWYWVTRLPPTPSEYLVHAFPKYIGLAYPGRWNWKASLIKLILLLLCHGLEKRKWIYRQAEGELGTILWTYVRA